MSDRDYFGGLFPAFNTLLSPTAKADSPEIETVTPCWNYENNYGQLGNGTNENSNEPVLVATSGSLAGKTLTAIYTGAYHACATDSEQQYYCWGNNEYGQFLDGTTQNSNTSVKAQLPDSLNNKTITSFYTLPFATFIHTTDGTTYYKGTGGEIAFNNFFQPMRIKIGNFELPPSAINYIDSYTIEITMPPHSAGPVDITIINPDGESFTFTKSYTYIPAPNPPSPSNPPSSNISNSLHAPNTGSNHITKSVAAPSIAVTAIASIIALIYCIKKRHKNNLHSPEIISITKKPSLWRLGSEYLY